MSPERPPHRKSGVERRVSSTVPIGRVNSAPCGKGRTRNCGNGSVFHMRTKEGSGVFAMSYKYVTKVV
jgi:hypothetical protein